MASNSPGSYVQPLYVLYNEDNEMLSCLINDVTDSQGKYHMGVAGGYQRDTSFVVKESGYYVNTSDGASTCSSGTAETCDLEGGTLLVLETKSLRNFTTNDEYLFAMKEDLAEWFSSLYQNVEITADNLFQVLETGVLLCKHANKVQELARQRRELGETLEMRSYFIRAVPERNVSYREEVRPETFQARDNVSNFISWGRQLGIPDVLSFETDDLVLRKNEKSVILCLLEVARVGAKLGMLAPTLVQMEQEIDAELAGEKPLQQIQIKTCDLRSLDERVRDLIGRCTCPVQFPMIKVSEGKYKIGDTRSLIFVRILRNHVMVRVGGGWDTLEHYLNKHDPCQCKYRGHRSGTPGAAHKVVVSDQRRSSMSATSSFPVAANSSSSKPAPLIASTSRNNSASPQIFTNTDSSTLVISRHIPAPATTGASFDLVKGTNDLPTQKLDVRTRNLESSNNYSSNPPIRSDSPNMGREKSCASPTVKLNVSQQNSSPQSSLLAQHLCPGLQQATASLDKQVTEKTNTEIINSMPGEFKSHVNSVLPQSKLKNQLSSKKESSHSANKPGKNITKNSNFIGGTGEKILEIKRRNSLPQFSIADNFKFPTALGANSSEAKTNSQKNIKNAKLNFPRKTKVSVSKPGTPTLSSGYGQNLVSGVKRFTGTQVPSHARGDTVADVVNAISDWLETTNKVDITSSSHSRVLKDSLAESHNNTLQKQCEMFKDTLGAGQVHLVANVQVKTVWTSTIKERPASNSRIPKPNFASDPNHSMIPNSLSANTMKCDTTTSNQTVQGLNLYPATHNIILNKKPGSCTNPSSTHSLNKSQLPQNSISSYIKGSTPEIPQTQAEQVSMNNKKANFSFTDIPPGMKTVASATDLTKQIWEPNTSEPHEDLSTNSNIPNNSISGNTNAAQNTERRSSVTPESEISLAELQPKLLNAASNLDIGQQVFNEITFSDDEEINEMLRNSARKVNNNDGYIFSIRTKDAVATKK